MLKGSRCEDVAIIVSENRGIQLDFERLHVDSSNMLSMLHITYLLSRLYVRNNCEIQSNSK